MAVRKMHPDFGRKLSRTLPRERSAGPARLVAPKLQDGRRDNPKRKQIMKLTLSNADDRKSISGRISLVLLWLIGVPVPILIIIFLFRSCMGG